MNKQTIEQKIAMIKAIMSTLTGKEFNGYEARQYFNDVFGIDNDHHLYTEVMDVMTRTGRAVCTQGWGDTRYLIS
jgi:hypothetical protein